MFYFGWLCAVWILFREDLFILVTRWTDSAWAEAVGHALLRLDSDTGRAGFDLTELFVTPAQRGQGIGRRLIAAARAAGRLSALDEQFLATL